MSRLNVIEAVQTECNWSYLSSQSIEFRGVFFFIDSYTKVQLLLWSRVLILFIYFHLKTLPSSLNDSRLVSLRLLLVLMLPLNWTLGSGACQHRVLLFYTGIETGFPAGRMALHMLLQNTATCTHNTQQPKKRIKKYTFHHIKKWCL